MFIFPTEALSIKAFNVFRFYVNYFQVVVGIGYIAVEISLANIELRFASQPGGIWKACWNYLVWQYQSLACNLWKKPGSERVVKKIDFYRSQDLPYLFMIFFKLPFLEGSPLYYNLGKQNWIVYFSPENHIHGP